MINVNTANTVKIFFYKTNNYIMKKVSQKANRVELNKVAITLKDVEWLIVKAL